MEKLPYDIKYDLTNCDKEPLQWIRMVQDNSHFMRVDANSQRITAVSESMLTTFGCAAEDFFDQPLSAFLPDAGLERINQLAKNDFRQLGSPVLIPEWRNGLKNTNPNLLIFRSGDDICLEFEQRDGSVSRVEFLLEMDEALYKLQMPSTDENLYQRTVNTISSLIKFDRVMLYRFDDEYNGEVIAEAKKDHLEPYLNLRYPHTDIPAQARELFIKNQVRHLTDLTKPQTNLIHCAPGTSTPNLTDAANRGTSPIHIEYLQNMGVCASLSIAIVVENRLWGLIACHHYEPCFLDYRLRSMISLAGKVVAGHLALRQNMHLRRQMVDAGNSRSALYNQMAQNWDIREGLMNGETNLLELISATTAILVLEEGHYVHGVSIEDEEISELVSWLDEKDQSFYQSSNLFVEYPAASTFVNPVAGLLAIKLSPQVSEYLIWLRPETIQTINWAGKPSEKNVVATADGQRLSPRSSFAQYSETVAGKSTNWQQYEVDAAVMLRSDIKEILLKKYQEAKKMNTELSSAYEEMETFSYTVSHDLRAPLRNIRSLAEIIAEDYGDRIDEEGNEIIQMIISSVGKMNQFINDILAFSRVGRTEIDYQPIELPQLLNEIWEEATFKLDADCLLAGAQDLPKISGNVVMIRQLFANLLGNSIKYSRKRIPLQVSMDCSETEDGFLEIRVTDNGIGFEPRHAESVFTVFNRLVNNDEYQGTGIGLAISKRIVEKHGGKIRAEGRLGEGATFIFTLPLHQS